MNWLDPWGLKIIYNKKPPYTVPPSGETLNALECLDECLSPSDLLVTGGSEKSGHTKGSSHYENKACDIAGDKYNDLPGAKTVKECAKKCGFTHGQYENYPGTSRDHWHFQIGPNLGVPGL